MLDEELIRFKTKLIKLLNLLDKKKQNRVPGEIRLNRINGKQRYEIKEYGSDKFVYATAEMMDRVRRIAQTKYEIKLEKILEENLATVNKFISKMKKDELAECYNALPEGRKCLIKPVYADNDMFARLWQEDKYNKKKSFQQDAKYTTSRGEEVRSKSEVMIADRLVKFGVPYRYECPVKCENTILYPDFTVLNKRTREVFYYEHLGMMDCPEYREQFFYKIRTYSSAGIVFGKNLVATFEDKEHPFDLKVLDSLIKNCFL